MPKVGASCPHCHEGQLLPNDDDDLSCVQCGNIVYADPPAMFEPDRRSRTDNRQNPVVFADEYRRALPKEEFEEAFEDFKDIMEEGS